MVIIGHSHLNCIAEAARANGADAREISLWVWPNVVMSGPAGRQLGEELKAAMTGLVISAVGGGAQHVMGLHPHPQPFDFVAPEQPDLPMIEGATIVPHDQIRDTMLRVGASDFEVLRLMGEWASDHMIHVPPPPTLRDERPIDHPLWRKVVGESDRISSAYFRRKLELVHASLFREICETAGVTLAPTPPDSIDEEGFLLPEFAGPPCHGNARYGALVLEQIKALAT